MRLNESLRAGLSFGLVSGIVTTLGLMVGLHSGTHSQLAVLGGILTIAVADAFSDAMGIHVSEESEKRHSQAEVWQSTAATFLTKFFVAVVFVVPVLLLPLSTAIAASVAVGLAMIALFSFFSTGGGGPARWKQVLEHLGIAAVVIIATHFAGDWIAATFM